MTFQDNTAQQQPPVTTVDSGNGFLVGVDPVQPRNGQQNGQQQPPEQAQQPPQGTGRFFSEEDVERIRQQEKDKLYGRIEEMGTELRTMREEAVAREQAAQEAIQQAAAAEAEAQRQREEEELSVRELLTRREQEWETRFTEQQQSYARDRAIFDQERSLTLLGEYRRDRIEQESPFIIPELRNFVNGNSPEEIDQSIEFIKQQSAAISANFAAAAEQQVQQQPFRGAAMPSVPPVGPMEQLPSYESMSPEVIAAMDNETYKRYRPQLLQQANPYRRAPGR
jgi:hypothetical protein